MTENITQNDIYIQHLSALAVAANQLQDELEKVLEVEEGEQGNNFLVTLEEIDHWLDRMVARQEKRLAYAMTLVKATPVGLQKEGGA
jgi:hypothetical protein